MTLHPHSETLVPGPSDATASSVAHEFRRNPVTFVTDLVRTYGDLVRLPFEGRDLYLLNHPDFVREMFLGRPSAFAKRKDPEAEQDYLGSISSFVPLFRADVIPSYAASITEAALRRHRLWESRFAISGPFAVDIYREFGALTLEIVIRTLFGMDGEADASDLFDAMLTMDVGYGFDPIEATLGVLMPEAAREMTPLSRDARARIEAYIARLARAEQNRRGSFLTSIIQNVGVEHAVPVAMTVMFAMHEVTVTTLPWAWYLLSKRPDVDRTLTAELATILGGREARYEDLPGLSYAEMVLSETRRLYPAVWIVGRFVREDVFFNQYRIPAGSVVLASQQIMHRDPRFYPQPDRFDPLRWTADSRASRPECSYFPFSAGPRACAGEHFAKLQDALILATLAQRWHSEELPGEQPKAVPQQSSAPRKGIRMLLARR